jgi:hypothetical protein
VTIGEMGLAVRSERTRRAGFVGAHEATVARHIGGQDGC